MEKNSIEDIARQIYSKAEATPPADAWDKIRTTIAAGSTSPLQGGENARHATKGADKPASKSNQWTTYFILATAVIACVASIIVALSHNGDDAHGQEAMPADTLPAATQPQDIHTPRDDNAAGSFATGNTAHATAAALARCGAIQLQALPARATQAATPHAIVKNPGTSMLAHAAAAAHKGHSDTPHTANGYVQDAERHDVSCLNASTQQAPAEASPTHVTATEDNDGAPLDNSSPSRYNDAATAANTSHFNATDRQDNEPMPCIGNIITPNGDGINDFFEIKKIEQYRPVQVEIFTARGKRVFHSANYQNEFNAAGLPKGNYFYIVTYHTPKPRIRRGTLVVTR